MPARSAILVKVPTPASRQQAVEAIDRTLARFPLVTRILGELGRESVPMLGDADLRHGCERALTGMMSGLAKIGRAPAGPAHDREDALRALCHRPDLRALVDADKLERLQQFIDAILGEAGR